MNHVYFKGKAKWARLLSPDEKYNKYNISVGLDSKQYKELQALKVKNSGKLDDDGIFWVSFNRKAELGAPKCVDSAGDPVSDLVGNDSEVTIKVEVKTWTRDGIQQAAVVLDSVRVDNLVRYEKKMDAASNSASTSAIASSSPLPSPKGKMF